MSETSPLATAIARCVDALAPGAREALIDGLRSGVPPEQLAELVATQHYRGVVRDLARAWSTDSDTSGKALALAIEASASAAALADGGTLSLVWSGPPTQSVPVRRTDQTLLELIRAARQRLIIVSFAVYRVDSVANALTSASDRGVDVAVVLESAEASEGNVSYEMAAALGSEVAGRADIYTWPAERRPRNERGSPASLHVKCAVADRQTLLVSSANLTESALERNMELGLLVRGGPIPERVHTHFEHLIEREELAPVKAG